MVGYLIIYRPNRSRAASIVSSPRSLAVSQTLVIAFSSTSLGLSDQSMSSSCSHDLDRRVNVILNEINIVKPELFQSELPECHSTRNSSRSTSGGSTSVSTSPTIELLDNAKHAIESSSLSNSQQHIVTGKVNITIHIHRWQKLLLAMKKSKQSQASIDVSARWSVFEDTEKSRRKLLNIWSGYSIYFPRICEERGSYHSCYKKSSPRKEPSAAAKGRVLTTDAAAPDRLKIRSDGRNRELAAWVEMRRISGGELQGQLERSITSMRSYITYASTNCETSDSIHPDSGALSYRPSAK